LRRLNPSCLTSLSFPGTDHAYMESLPLDILRLHLVSLELITHTWSHCLWTPSAIECFPYGLLMTAGI